MRNFVEDVCLDVLRVGLSVVSNSYVLVLLSIFLAVVPAEAQQVNERMRSTFAVSYTHLTLPTKRIV